MTEKSERTPEELQNEMESLNIETKYRYLPESRGSRELANNGVS